MPTTTDMMSQLSLICSMKGPEWARLVLRPARFDQGAWIGRSSHRLTLITLVNWTTSSLTANFQSHLFLSSDAPVFAFEVNVLTNSKCLLNLGADEKNEFFVWPWRLGPMGLPQLSFWQSRVTGFGGPWLSGLILIITEAFSWFMPSLSPKLIS